MFHSHGQQDRPSYPPRSNERSPEQLGRQGGDRGVIEWEGGGGEREDDERSPGQLDRG